MIGRPARTPEVIETFLATIAASCNVSAACRAAKISRRTAYNWREDDAEFAAAWDSAIEEAVDKLEAEAWRRAHDGVDKPVTYQGEITATYKEYSDRMLEILLKAHRPDKYVDKLRNEHTGRDGGAIKVEQTSADAEAFVRSLTQMAARAASPE